MSHGTLGGIQALAPQSRLYQGAFGRLFPELPAWDPDVGGEKQVEDHFFDIAENEMREASDAATADNTEIPAGYTYFGQFVDHDITFDPVSSLMRANDPNGLNNFRTPRLDLDNLYGRGPGATPHLYQKDNKAKFLLGTVEGTAFSDLPRNAEGTALIGDPRNDENRIIGNMQVAFLRAHNTLVDRAGGDFEQARRALRWLYQFVVWNDFVKRIVNDEIWEQSLILDTSKGRKVWRSDTESIFGWKHQPFMPVEFAVAAYRFGHSMVRNAYRTNISNGFSIDTAIPLFHATDDDLRGGTAMPLSDVVQWDWFLDIDSRGEFPQASRKIDVKLSGALSNLPDEQGRLNVLAFRNLMRGWRFGLPSGTAIAERLGYDPMTIDHDHDSLWFYILKEAESIPAQKRSTMLGKVGSAIVASTFAGLLRGDPQSYFAQKPGWTPEDDPLLGASSDDTVDGEWVLGSIMKIAGVPISASDIQN